MTWVATARRTAWQIGWRRLFRADGLHRLTEADRRQLIDLGVATVIDLRTVDEAEQRGRFPVEEVPVRYVDLPLTDVLPTTEEMPSWAEASYVASRYALMVSEGAPALTGAFAALASGGSLPAVFHCSAGKDRTGVLSALILAFLGVPDETIVADYALSGPAMEHLLERLKAEYPDAVEDVMRYAPAVLQVRPETMEEFLASLRTEYGTYEDLADVAGRHRRRGHPAPDRPGRGLSGPLREAGHGLSVGSTPCPASSTRRNST